MSTPTNTAPAVTIGDVSEAAQVLAKQFVGLTRAKSAVKNATGRAREAYDELARNVALLCESVTLATAASMIAEHSLTLLVPNGSATDWSVVSKITELKVAQIRDSHLMADITGGKAHQHYSQMGFTNQSKAGTSSFGVNWDRLVPAVQSIMESESRKAPTDRMTPVEMVAIARHNVNVRMSGEDVKGAREAERETVALEQSTAPFTVEQLDRIIRNAMGRKALLVAAE